MSAQFRKCKRQNAAGESQYAVKDAISYKPNRVGLSHGLNLETITEHAALILVDQGLTLLGGIVGFGEEHAVVASGFLIFADAARLK